MLHKTSSPIMLPLALVWVGFSLGLGCKSAAKHSQSESAKVAEMAAYWSPHLLLTSDSRYRKIHVEIDAVEGAAPNPSEIQSIQSFLESHCRQAGDVQVVLDDIIPRQEAKGRLSQELLLKHMDGAPDEDSAFIYVLFFDSSLSKEKKSEPFCMITPYPGAIFVDHRYVNGRLTRNTEFLRLILLHETAHALGLTRESGHSDGLHCTNANCLMNPKLYVSISKWIFGKDPIRQKAFCADCETDLDGYGNAQPAANLRYHGPYFIRSEALYHVVTLPGLVYVHVGPLAQLDEDKLKKLRANAIQMTREGREISFATSSIDLDMLPTIVAAMRADPVKTVRIVADKLQAQAESRDDAQSTK